MTKTLTVRNIEQAAAFLELDGQLSDGFWENARPNNHWRPWTEAEVVVGERVGRDFWAPRLGYNFASKELLDTVGRRMLGLVRIARVHGMEVARHLEFAVDTETGRIDWARQTALGDIGRAEIDVALADEVYGMRELRRDLRDLMAIIKIDNTDYSAVKL